MRIVVTGAAGFIGGVTVLKLLDYGHEVLAIDRSLEPNRLHEWGATTLVADVAGEVALTNIRSFQPDAIIHCAGTSLVGPSVMNPAEYYDNNFVKTKILLDYLRNHNIRTRFVFSSSAATYGNPVMIPCGEMDPAQPISPYGESKLMVDWMLRSYNHAYGQDYVSFRYFNACGADSQARHGQAPGATHIIARVLESVLEDRAFTLYGTDYFTEDGTCIRDYVHVEDLAQAHILACDTVIPAGLYNLGTNTGTSNLEIIRTAEQVTGKTIQVTKGERRAGDPDRLIADSSRFVAISGWRPKYTVADMIAHAWAWYQK